jgi:GT2 family glycosyltransferase
MTPPVTLLLPNRDNERVLDLTLERLLEHTTYPNFELVAVDDGSTDDSRSILRRWRDARRFREFTLIERDHGGIAGALNAGLAAASGELIVSLDGDATIETPGWLERMVDLHQSDPRIGVVTPLVTFESGTIHAAGIHIVCREGLHDRGTRPLEPPGQRTVHTRVERSRPESAGSLITHPAEVDTALGAQMLYSRDMVAEVGGYDPGFSPVWFEDLDLSLSARRVGLKVMFVPGVQVIHRTSLRDDRTALSGAARVRKRVRSTVASVTPERLRRKVRHIEQQDTSYKPHELRRVHHHYAYWRQKWGFDLLNPDVDEIRHRYGDTEVCWRFDPDRRAAGEQILSAWSARAPGADR